jgi:hypothetical protein
MMTDRNPAGSNRLCRSGNSILSANEAAREASQLTAEGPSLQQLASLARDCRQHNIDLGLATEMVRTTLPMFLRSSI